MKENKAVSIVITLFPILSVYGLYGVDFGTMAVICVSLFILLKKEKITLYKSPLQILFIYIAILTPILLLSSHICGLDKLPTVFRVFLRYGKLLILLFLVFNLGINKYFKLDYAFKVMKYAVYINTIFIVIQWISYKFLNYPLINPLLPFGINSDGSSFIVTFRTLYRPSAFFGEPAYLAQYFFIFLCYTLFAPNLKVNNRIIDTSVAGVGIILSTSGMGIVGLVMLLIVFLLKMIICIILTGLVISLYNTNFMQLILSRITDGGAIESRVGTGYKIFGALPLQFMLFGCGFGNVPVGVYLDGIEYSLICIGIFGTIILFFLLLKNLKKSVFWIKMLTLTFLGLLLISQSFTATNLIVYFTIFNCVEQHIVKEKLINN